MCVRALRPSVREEFLFEPAADDGAVCVAPCSPARKRRGACSGRRPPAAINHRDGRSTAHEALRPTPASLGGGSYAGLEIHPSPSSCHVPASPQPRGGRNKEEGQGGREGERNLSALLGHITQFSLPAACTYEEPRRNQGPTWQRPSHLLSSDERMTMRAELFSLVHCMDNRVAGLVRMAWWSQKRRKKIDRQNHGEDDLERCWKDCSLAAKRVTEDVAYAFIVLYRERRR
ncbi:hypothetical protein Q5P01_004806 [Channa striata]|uniref:Uncharacterized protein n=1 Tax=Channa striata TaxID=64152 RepID=A0AA88NEZ0_CHASR|nr:hypothetical protein Q5P01_004806 [Channa striata]